MATAPIGPLGPAPVGLGPMLDAACKPAAAVPDGPFARVIDQVLAKVRTQQAAADQAVLDLATGKTDNIHEVMLAVTKADLTFRTLLEVRNRVTDAYQDIIRMAV
jgi:flagellar hook-basal body complex protein FliE